LIVDGGAEEGADICQTAQNPTLTGERKGRAQKSQKGKSKAGASIPSTSKSELLDQRMPSFSHWGRLITLKEVKRAGIRITGVEVTYVNLTSGLAVDSGRFSGG